MARWNCQSPSQSIPQNATMTNRSQASQRGVRRNSQIGPEALAGWSATAETSAVAASTGAEPGVSMSMSVSRLPRGPAATVADMPLLCYAAL